MSKKNKKREDKESAEQQQERRSFARHLFYLGIAGAVCVVGGLTYMLSKETPDRDLYRKEEMRPREIPKNISFEMAVANKDEELRQSYLEQLLARESKITKEWQAFEKFIYDPGFKKFEKNRDTNERKNEINGYEDMGKDFIVIAKTYARKGFKADCYLSELCFDNRLHCCEDELKSAIDHESFHAYEKWTGIIQLTAKGMSKEEGIEILKKINLKTAKMALEFLSFDHQHSLIVSGKRKVSDRYRSEINKNCMRFHGKFEEISKNDNEEGKFAKIILNSLNNKPY